MWAGEADKAVESIRKAMRLNPAYPGDRDPVFHMMASYGAEDYETVLEVAKELPRPRPTPKALMAASYLNLGRQAKAKEVAADLVRDAPAGDPGSVRRHILNQAEIYKHKDDAERLLKPLRELGIVD